MAHFIFNDYHILTSVSYKSAAETLLDYTPSKKNKEVDIPMDPGIFVLNNHTGYKRQ